MMPTENQFKAFLRDATPAEVEQFTDAMALALTVVATVGLPQEFRADLAASVRVCLEEEIAAWRGAQEAAA